MTRGGKRKRAGRSKGTGKFGEPTKAVRLPISLIDQIMAFIERKGLAFPLYETRVHAGYPAPDSNIPAERFDLVTNLVPNPDGTFYVRMSGKAMEGVGFYDQDILIVDKSREPRHDDIVVAVVKGEFTVRRLVIKNKKIELKPENPKFATIRINDESELNIWGVVTNAIHSVSLVTASPSCPQLHKFAARKSGSLVIAKAVAGTLLLITLFSEDRSDVETRRI